jgi:hypothetical protein
MSLTSKEYGARTGDAAAGAAGVGDRGPLLIAGAIGYAAWKPKMEVFLGRVGVDGVHRREVPEAQWSAWVALVEQWADEEFASALSLVAFGSAAGGWKAEPSASAAAALPSAPDLDEKTKAARKALVTRVERSRKAFGIIYQALPEELGLQVAHILHGWAYGLWTWLERKFQSTEADNVNNLLAQWADMKQQGTEKFDTYRARVNQLFALLKHAKEPQSVRNYGFTLVEKLLPPYESVKLALKNGVLLQDYAKVDWDAVAAIINAHERNIMPNDITPAQVMATQQQQQQQHQQQQRKDGNRGTDRGSGNGGGGRGGRHVRLDDVQCYNCKEMGHFRSDCPKPKRPYGVSAGGDKGTSDNAAPNGNHAPGGVGSGNGGQRKEQAKSVTTGNPFDELSKPIGVSEAVSFSATTEEMESNVVLADATEAACDLDSSALVCAVDSQMGTRKLLGVDSMASLSVSGDKNSSWSWSLANLCW